MGVPSGRKPLRSKERRNALRLIWRFWKGGCFVTETLRLKINSLGLKVRTNVRGYRMGLRSAAKPLRHRAGGAFGPNNEAAAAPRKAIRHRCRIDETRSREGLAESLLSGCRRSYERLLTHSGKFYCDSVFGRMAFFPIVNRKFRGYVALHNELEARAERVATLRERFRGGGSHSGMTIRPEAPGRHNECLPMRDGWQRRIRRRADAVSIAGRDMV